MFFHWIRIILSNKYDEYFYFDKKRKNLAKGALNLLGWSQIRKIKIHQIRILPKPEIHPIRILLESKYTRQYLTRPPNWQV